jgi:hypothetical protein
MGMQRIAIVVAGFLALAGCASSHNDPGQQSSTLNVHIGMFGGPLTPNGHMADSDAPAVGKLITAADTHGHQWRARTGNNGTATFTLPPGHYSVVSSYCGTGPQQVVTHPHHDAQVQIQCDIP